MIKRILTILAILFSVAGTFCSAQQQNWDAALDRYDYICRKCLEMRNKVIEGESVPKAELNTLIAELYSLREQLKDAEGSMNQEQLFRFRQIRRRYQPETAKTALKSDRHTIAAIDNVLTDSPITSPAPNLLAQEPGHRVSIHRIRNEVYGIVSVPALQAGAAYTFLRDNWGLYIKAQVAPILTKPDGLCLSNGTEGDSYIWTTGKYRKTGWGASAGIVWESPVRLRAYAGAGYGTLNLLWEEVSGRWLKVTDKSYSGVQYDAGLMLPIGNLNIIAGISSMDFKLFNVEFGAGFSF